MPFARPTLADLDARLVADLESRLPGTDPLLAVSYLGALVRSLAGSHHELYGFLEWIADQVFPDTADGPELLRWAAIWGVRPVAAIRATGTITVTGTATTVIPAGTVFQSGLAVEYETDAEVTIPAAGTLAVDVTAVLAGAAGNAVVGVAVTLVSPITGLQSAATVATALTGGADVESTESVRARLLARIQNPPRGGTVEDYELWARSASADVTRSWGRALAGGLGTVTVYFMTDDATDNGIPAAGTVTTVDDYIDDRRPVTADVTVAAPTAVANWASRSTAVMPMTQAVQDAIEAELADLIRREAEPGGTLLVSPTSARPFPRAAGEIDHVLTSPTAERDRAGRADHDARRRDVHVGRWSGRWRTPGLPAISFNKLLPRGRAWAADGDTTLVVAGRRGGRRAGADRPRGGRATLWTTSGRTPRSTCSPDWERVVGLPDDCSDLGSTIGERRASLLEKIVTKPTLNPSEFERIGETFGVTITVEELDQTRADAIAGLDTSGRQVAVRLVDRAFRSARTCAPFRVTGRVNEPLATFARNTELECRLAESGARAHSSGGRLLHVIGWWA